jgi:hypothetical protein
VPISGILLRASIVAVLISTAACHKEKPLPKGAPPPVGAKAEDIQAQEEAEFLGADLFEVIDRVVSYKTSHRGNVPRSLRQVGIDSLTGATARRLTIEDDKPTVTSAFRRTEGRKLQLCIGDSDNLEEAALNGGEFTVRCLSAGRLEAIKVGKPKPEKKD